MKDGYEITLTWCRKHKNWWVTNCPDCMVDSNEPSIRKDEIKKLLQHKVTIIADKEMMSELSDWADCMGVGVYMFIPLTEWYNLNKSIE